MSRYYKILKEDLNHMGFQYQEGLNVDINKISEDNIASGLHFADKNRILGFCDYGTMITEVEIPEDAIIYRCPNYEGPDTFRADKIILKNIRPLWSAKTIKALIQEGVNVAFYKDNLLCSAARKGYLDAVQYLVEHCIDIHDGNDHVTCAVAMRYAAKNGYLDIVKYLVEQGVDIHTGYDWALCSASEFGHFEIVKYLIEQGANVHGDWDCSLRRASKNGHIDIVKYLVGQGSDIHACDDQAIRHAGNPEIKAYLKSLL